MKELLFILLFVPFIVNGQSRYHSISWNRILVVTDMTGQDTVIQAYDYPDIGGYCWSCTVNAEDLDADDAQITFGGGDVVIGQYLGKYNIYDFNTFVHDSLPYTLNKSVIEYETKSMGITSTTYTKKITGGNVPYNCLLPAFWFDKGSCTGDTLEIECNFWKN